ncbi:MAG: RsmD family RNA methyltransferase [Bacteroidales bacterium]|nr:RsmD family RNA methyltransferase [Bacteroidales bacterium]
MRIIGGTHKGRRITPPPRLPVRPTTDLAKESLFNILNNLIDFEDLRVLDLFAGTGSISFEFASRQAAVVDCVDVNFKCLEFVRATAKELHLDNIRTFRADVFKFLKRPPTQPYDLIFSDAPFDLEQVVGLPEIIYGQGWLKKDAWLIIEHPRSVDFTRQQYFDQQRNYGKVNFSFFRQT